MVPLCLILSGVASAQSSDTSHSISVATVLTGQVINARIITQMIRQNIALTSESPHLITGSPLDAPDILIRVNIAESPDGNIVVLSGTGVSGGSGFTYQGTGSSSAPSAFPVDRGTHRGKEWKRLEDLAAALRASLVIR